MRKKILQIITALVINIILAWPLSYALSISNINHQVTSDSALITWNTDEHSTSSVHFGKNKNTELSKYNQTLVKEHSIKLSYLDFNTGYYYKVRSCNSENKCNVSQVLQFTTENIPPPAKITGLKNTSVTETTVSLSWDKSTNQYLKHYIVYRDNEIVGNVTVNSFTDSGLKALTTYSYQVSAVDKGYNIGEKSDILEVTTKEPDLSAPVISELKLAALTANSATITWTTDEDSNSTLYYGKTSSLENVQALKTYTKSHSIQVSGLNEGIVYYYRVGSCDISENCKSSELGEFVPGADTTLPAIEVVLPEYHNKEVIYITGKTKPFSEVKFYVNGVYRGILSKSSTGAEGKIEINLRGLQEGNNTIKIVAIDSHNLKSEKEISVVVDTKLPEYTITSIPKLSKERNLVISGEVSEPSTITFYSQIAAGINVPKKVSNFHSDYEKLTPNSVTLVWDVLEDVDHYAIYRKDVGLIGIPNKAPFVDNYANTSTTYTYEIAAVYKDCSFGPKVSIAVTTLDGGNVDIRKPTQLQEKCGGITPKGSINVEKDFTYSLGLNPGINEVVINITDKAGNTVLIKNTTIHDSSPPNIIYTNLDKLSPSYTKEVTIEGKVSEHSFVYVYIDDEEEASYKAETDENGEFKVKVELRRKVSGEYEAVPSSVNVRAESLPIWENDIKIIAVDDVGLESNPVTSKIAYQLCGYGGDWQVEVGDVTPDIIVPRFLLQGVARIGFNVNFKWQGPGKSKDATITERPSLILRPLNKADQEKFDEEFFGPVHESHSNYYRSSYFLIDLKKPYLEGQNQTTLQLENNISKNNLGGCVVPGFGCIKLPLMLEIHYAYKDPYGTTLTGARGEEYEPLARRNVERGVVYVTQRQCFDVEIAIDRRLPTDKILPKNLLKGAIDFLNASIKTIDYILEPVDLAKKFVFIGCMGSWVVWLGFKLSEWMACNKLSQFAGGFNPNNCDPRTEGKTGKDLDDANACASCLRARAQTLKYWEKATWICDRVLCPAAPTIQKYVRDVKRETSREENLQIPEDYRQRSHCEQQDIGSIIWDTNKNKDSDKEYRDIENFELEVRNVEKDKNIPGEPDQEYCESEYIMNYDPAAIFMNEFKESWCVSKQKDEPDPEGVSCKGIGTVPRLLRGVCEAKEEKGPRMISSEGETYLITDWKVGQSETDNNKVRAAYKITEKVEIKLEEDTSKENFFKVDQSNFFIENFGGELKNRFAGQDVYVSFKPEELVMDENDCYIVTNERGERVHSDNAKLDPSREYIEYEDLLDQKTRKDIGVDYEDGRPKKDVWYIGNFKPQMCGRGVTRIGEEKLEDGDTITINMKIFKKEGNVWKQQGIKEEEKAIVYDSYEKLQKAELKDGGTLTKNSVKYRYIPEKNYFETTSKDCTHIPRAVWEEVCGDDAKDYVIDPTGDLISAFQSGCLTAISAYLQQYKTMLQMLKGCFEQILYTGEGSSGVCKQVLSVYICDLIYYAIRCIVEKSGKGYGPDKIQGGVFGFINYLRTGGANIQNSIRGRYGTSAMYRVMFVERKLIHSACAAAFTGDYDLDLDAMLDAQIVTPVQTMCYISGNRRFAYANPQTGTATFLYNLGVFIVSGGSAGAITTGRGATLTSSTREYTTPILKPINYRVQLVCSNTNRCKSDISETGACDCLAYTGEKTGRSPQGEVVFNLQVGDGTLEQGETLNEEVFFDKAENRPYRFDRARILVSYVDNQGKEHIDEVCGETYLDGVGAEPPAMCKFDITQGFICEFEWGEFVTAYFDNVQIKTDTPRESIEGSEQLYLNDVLELEGYIRKEGSEKRMEEQKVSLKYRLYSYGTLLYEKDIAITNRNTNLETDPDFKRGDYAFPGIKVVDTNTELVKENQDTKLIEVNPFIEGILNPALDWYPEEGYTVSAKGIDKMGMFSTIEIEFTKDGNDWYYIIRGDCDKRNGVKQPYTRSIVCITDNGHTLTISGTPTREETLRIMNDKIKQQQEGIRPLRFVIELHGSNEYGEMDPTILTYDKEPQKKEFKFYIERKAEEEPKRITKLEIDRGVVFGTLDDFTGPRTAEVDTIVLHHTGGPTTSGAIEELRKQGYSVHYIVNKLGIIYQIVDENKVAFHAGCTETRQSGKSLCSDYNEYKDINERSIGIEIVNTGKQDDEFTREQYGAVKLLIGDIAKRHGFTVDKEHVIGHFQITNDKLDPSPNFDWIEMGLSDHPEASGHP